MVKFSPLHAPDASAALATLIGRRRTYAFRWADVPVQAHFSPAATLASTCHVELSVGEQVVQLGFPAIPVPGTHGAPFAGIELAGLPPELRLGVLEAWLQEPLLSLQRLGLAVALRNWSDEPPSTPPACAWEIARGDHDVVLCGTLHANEPALAVIAAFAARAPAAPAAATELSVAVSVQLPSLALALATLRQVEVGDALLLSSPIVNYSLWADQRLLGEASRDGAQFTFQAMKSTPSASASTAETRVLQVDELPVQVVFEIGELVLPVGELRTLADGHVFTLPDADAAITIRANGREVGRGELVRVGERAAVRVVSWNLT